MLTLWHRAVLNKTNFIENFHTVTTHQLDQPQMAIFQQILEAMDNHNEHYSSIHEFSHIGDDEDEDLFAESNENPQQVSELAEPLPPVDWRKFF